MTEYNATRNADRRPTHPGELLTEVVIPATGKTKTEIAERLGISRQHLHDLLTEKKPVTANVAVRLGALFGNGGGLWLHMQGAYDLWGAEREVDVAAIKRVEAA